MLTKSGGTDWYHFLHIRGGSGINPNRPNFRYGGEYNIILFYVAPGDSKSINKCERIWCIENNIPYGEGNSIEEAYKDFLEKVKINPLK